MTTLYVSAVDGSNSDNGLSWANAKQTVAGALAIASDGDVNPQVTRIEPRWAV